MKQKIEQTLRLQNPEPIAGLDEQKVKDAVGTLTDRVGKKGKTVVNLSISLSNVFFSTREINMLAHKLKNHALRITGAQVDLRWHDTSTATHKYSV